MADQSFPVESGFYDAINQDRVYTADDMNRPYNRVVSDGVFATKAGTPSTDLQVFPGEGERKVLVSAGQAIILHKWFELPSPVTVTVPENNTLFTRIDSVIARVDLNDAVRAGSIVYRTGTAAAWPTPPEINQDGTNVLEYRVANVHVTSGATTITASAIEDLRGSAECPWITGLITQVDTSALFAQYQSAYQEQYAKYDEDYEDYIEAQQERWDAFMESLTEELTVQMSVVPLKATSVVSGTTTTMTVPFAEFNAGTDVLDVFINALMAVQGVDYTISGSTVTFATALEAGARVDFRLLKAVIASNVENAMQIVRRMDEIVSAFTSDTGEIAVALSSGVTAVTGKTPTVRAVGGRVYLRGSVKGLTGTGQIGTIPADLVPSVAHSFASGARASGTVTAALLLTVSETGIISVSARSATYANTAEIPLNTTFLAAAQPTIAVAYNYKGVAGNYSNLPANPATGDVYEIQNADVGHNIEAGDWVMWDGEEWQKMNGVLTHSELVGIVNNITIS